MRRIFPWGVWALSLAAAIPAHGQDVSETETEAEETEPEETERGETERGETPTLPAPSLEDPEMPTGPAPDPPEEEEETPAVLHHIGVGDHPDWEESADDPVPADVPFVVPDDMRVASGGQLPPTEPEEGPKTFALAVGAGFARLLADPALDFFAITERFDFRVEGFEALRIGAGASELIGQSFLFDGGARIGLGAFFCQDRIIRCEGVATLQLGVATGGIGTYFSIHADLDLHFLFDNTFQLTVEGGYSLLGTNSLLFASGLVGLTF